MQWYGSGNWGLKYPKRLNLNPFDSICLFGGYLWGAPPPLPYHCALCSACPLCGKWGVDLRHSSSEALLLLPFALLSAPTPPPILSSFLAVGQFHVLPSSTPSLVTFQPYFHSLLISISEVNPFSSDNLQVSLLSPASSSHIFWLLILHLHLREVALSPSFSTLCPPEREELQPPMGGRGGCKVGALSTTRYKKVHRQSSK